jgi:hypothetical protein
MCHGSHRFPLAGSAAIAVESPENMELPFHHIENVDEI